MQWTNSKWGYFSETGTYVITTPDTPTKWENVLFNDEYVLTLSQRAKGKSHRVKNDAPIDLFAADRSFFINYEGSGYRLFQGEGKKYRVEYDLGSNVMEECFGNFSVRAEAFVPVSGKKEFWKFHIENTSEQTKDISLFCHFPFVNNGPMGGECRLVPEKNYVYKFSFPYHVRYEDMEKVKDDYAWTYILADCPIVTYDGSSQAFWGVDNPFRLPVALKNNCCSNTPGEGDDIHASVQFKWTLAPGESCEVVLMLGNAISKEEIERVAVNSLLYEEELKNVKQLWSKRCEAYQIETPNKAVNYLFNRWFLKQAVYLTRLNRSSVYCPVRNQLQDALGYSMIEPEEAMKWARKIIRRQHMDGYLKQWYMTDGSPERDLCKIEHSDACIWLILCVTEIIQNIGEKDIFFETIPYMDSEKEETILEHLRKAAKYMASQVGVHGLCLFKDGDWTDPINGVGRRGRGESVWNSMALVYAIHQLTAIFDDLELEEIAMSMTENINRYCWDGEWYIAGFDDDGIPFGKKGDEEAELFLNTQTWAFISDIVPVEYQEVLAASIEKLRLPFGYQLLTPAFSEWNKTWGRISIKQKGTTENGSVYCHGSMFKALGDCMRGDYEMALETIYQTLPVYPENPVEQNLQIPIYVPNYYFGLKGDNFGKSSLHSGTGTNAWIIWVMLKYVLGIKTDVNGIHFDEHVPASLTGTKIWRKYRGQIYEFECR